MEMEDKMKNCKCCGSAMEKKISRVCNKCREKGHTNFNCRKCFQILEEELRREADKNENNN